MIPYPSMNSAYLPQSHGTVARGPAQTVPHLDSSALERWSHNPVIGLTGNEYDEPVEPPAKRQRLETGDGISDTFRVPPTDDSAAAIAPKLGNSLAVTGWGKPPWSFGDGMPNTGAESGISVRSLERSQQRPYVPFPPFPVRPWAYGPPQNPTGSGFSPSEAVTANHVQTTSYNLEAPKSAPIVESDKVADFYPWRGIHPEDTLNEQTAKHGYYDHVQVSQNESNTARPALYPHLKHRPGLQALSSVFAMALEKRQEQTRVAESSTFKPPPRVTLTDMKREAWLRDLANPLVPLRRLSRTIPHGIRGKGLLDQCLGKSIPIGRAIWLAKCVGANDIRAFKRKGTTPAVASGLEYKWVRDWTVNVIQFLEGVIGSCGVDGWKANLSYAALLSSRLFLENLLDQEHFLEWFLSSLESASLEVLPVWLAMMNTYWKNLVGYRKRGRRVAECFLGRLSMLISAEHDGTLRPLYERLRLSVKKLLSCSPSCFILPKTWGKYSNTLASCLESENPAAKALFVQLSNRNIQVSKTKNSSKDSVRFPIRQLIRLLDHSMTSYIPDLTSECLKIQLDHGTFVSTVLLWASTIFRSGLSRVYIAVRLLRRLGRYGIDTDAHILSFLVNHSESHDICFSNTYHIISELVRSQSFSTSRYLQWLVARGAVSNAVEQGRISSDIRLLSNIPPRRLPNHVWNNRNMLLGRTGYSIAAEVQLIDRIKGHLQRRLPGMFNPGRMSVDSGATSGIDFNSLNWTVRSEISYYVRDHVTYLREEAQNLDGDSSAVAITLDEFCYVRHVLERLEDISILTDVLKHVSNSINSNVLIAALDTINHHFDSLSAIGATGDLFKAYFASYTSKASSNNATLELTTSLIELGIKLPAEIPAVAALRRDLAVLDRKYTLTASSPMSDHMSDTLSSVNSSTFPGTLAQLLTPGNNMDEATMARVFQFLSQMLVSNGPGNAKFSPQDVGLNLARLRAFNAKVFDSLMLKWVVSILLSPSRPELVAFLPPLIGVGCITFEAFLELLQKLFNSTEREVPDAPRLRVQVLEWLQMCPSSGGAVLDMVSYRYRTARDEFMARHLNSIMRIVSDVITDHLGGQDQSSDDWRNVKSCAVSIITELIVKSKREPDHESATSILHDFPNCKGVLQEAVNGLLGTQTDNSLLAARETLQLINDFSLPCCLARFRLLCDAEVNTEIRDQILDMVFKAVESDIRGGIPRWVDVMGVLSSQEARQVQQRAVQALLPLILPNAQLQSDAQDVSEMYARNEEAGRAYLQMIEELAWTIPDDQPPSLGGLLIEKFQLLLQQLATSAKSRNDLGAGPLTDQVSPLGFWIYVLLRLVAIYRSTLALNPTSKADIADQNRLLLLLCCISLSPTFTQRLDERCNVVPYTMNPGNRFQQSSPTTWRGLRTCALDVAASLVDTLPDEARHQCIRFIRERCAPIYHPQNNPYVLFLFGPVAEPPGHTLVGMANAASPAPVTPVQNTPGPFSQSQTPPAPTQPTNMPLITVEDPYQAQKLQFQQAGRLVGPCPPRPWEMLEESAPILGVNDTALNLAYFGTRQVRG